MGLSHEYFPLQANSGRLLLQVAKVRTDSMAWVQRCLLKDKIVKSLADKVYLLYMSIIIA